jgi:hypothetical protein
MTYMDLKLTPGLVSTVRKNILCTSMFLYIRYSFLFISNKFCDVSLLHWALFVQGGMEMR